MLCSRFLDFDGFGTRCSAKTYRSKSYVFGMVCLDAN